MQLSSPAREPMEHPASTSLGGRGAHNAFSGRRHRGGPSRGAVERQSSAVADRLSKAVVDRRRGLFYRPAVQDGPSIDDAGRFYRASDSADTFEILSMRPSPFADAGVPSCSPLLVESRVERVGVHPSDGYRHSKVNIVSVRWVYYLNNNYSRRSPRTVRRPNGAYLV